MRSIRAMGGGGGGGGYEYLRWDGCGLHAHCAIAESLLGLVAPLFQAFLCLP